MFKYEELLKEIENRIDIDYKKFHGGLLPGVNDIKGVRVPDIRLIAKKISRGDFGDYREYFSLKRYGSYEERMLYGLTIGYCKCDIKERLKYISDFVPVIDNWAVCDVFCGNLKIREKDEEVYYEFIKKYFGASGEFERRFGIIMLLSHFIREKYIKDIFRVCDIIDKDGYYVKMGIAWLISVCFVKYRDYTMEYLKNNSLDDFTYNKSLQKINESLRVDKDTKTLIKNMKR